MISKRERNKIKKILGNRYSDYIAEELQIRGVLSKKGTPYSPITIRSVMNGQEISEIETAIYSAVQRKNEEDLEEKQRREAILEQTKTGAATPA